MAKQELSWQQIPLYLHFATLHILSVLLVQLLFKASFGCHTVGIFMSSANAKVTNNAQKMHSGQKYIYEIYGRSSDRD